MATSEMRREEDGKGKSYELLPPELIGEILIRLPAKSIGRFKCVSKLFRSLSSDQRFAKRHVDLITTRNDSIHRKLLVSSSNNLYALDFDSIGGARDDLIAVQLDYPFKDVVVTADDHSAWLEQRVAKSINLVEIVGGSCNGLVCLSSGVGVGGGAMLLYNPTTGESKSLPSGYEDELRVCGFGFDDVTSDYKVVKLVATGRQDDLLNASVYSLKADSWRRIRDLRYKYFDGFNSGVNLNGACHWVLADDHYKKVVLAFNFITEAFREMPLPDDVDSCHNGWKQLVVGNLNGRLCVVDDDMWVMNEYGVASSWRKIQISLLYRSMKPLCSTNNSEEEEEEEEEEVLLQLDEDMVLYNFETNGWRKLEIRGVKLEDKFEACTYVESLLSPNLYGVERTEED